MKIFNIFKNKKRNSLQNDNPVDNFGKELSKFLDANKYISVKEMNVFKEKFKELYSSLHIIYKNNLIDSYAKNNNINSDSIHSFFNKYENIQSLVDLNNEKFISNSLTSEKEYLDGILKSVDKNILLDEDQRKVILTDEDYSLVVAGAGAGKTTTVAAKVKYLVEKKDINPRDILVISFTNKAVNELKERINKNLKIDCPITTFHSAGNAIIRKKNDNKLNIVDDGFLYNCVANYFKKIIKNPIMSKTVLLFFGSYFDYSYEGDKKNSLLNHIAKSDFTTMKSSLNEINQHYIDTSSKQKKTLNNEVVNSHQEVQIANYLYLNGIEYEYEPKYPYHISMSRKLYRPDFLIKQNGKHIYLEHFGISEDGNNDLYNEAELEKYKSNIKDKIKLHKTHNTKLIYTFSKYKDGKNLIEHLKYKLEKEGIVLNPIKYEEVYSKLVSIEENKYISKMTFLISGFISNFKTNGYTEEDFFRMIRTTKSERTKLFLEICRECYLDYQRELNKNNA
ncbi:MAG: UvrD-helicase domain-containing protein, partial [Tissierellia bacterium]|nr:UvrD-helicase domain-containing protein [Tissierellia bacterium]